MATDLKVQFFSHLNGINLGNNWGDLIRMLDTCLVNGLPFSSVTAANIDANGDINLTFFAAHNAVLFQIVELTGFAPSNINGKYRIKGLPTSTQMILKAELSGQSITTNGSAKLAALGYDIVFRDANDVKRVYRAKNPSSVHPFIRVDESISDGTNSYNSSYAKSAMVGLIENMSHIDDFLDTTKLQLPLDTSDLSKNWKISGTGTTVVRGWSNWYWATGQVAYFDTSATATPANGNRRFTIVGSNDGFFFNRAPIPDHNHKVLSGVGIHSSALDNSVIPNWFLMTNLKTTNAGSNISFSGEGGSPLGYNITIASFFSNKFSPTNKMVNSIAMRPIMPTYNSGNNTLFSGSDIAALEIPFYDADSKLRGNLPHVCYMGKDINTLPSLPTPIIGEKSMYIADYLDLQGYLGGLYFYLGELEV
ncbi:hypothetical protein [Acinetobacter junii]|uniref:hypothetical protein n=1 Tax=Acinetobacter junii TaxID=40215 RepID=UPI00124F0DFD|nr:hypothetical protein [Acinetobacter junii]